MNISTISLINSNAQYLPNSISKYYKYVEEIVLGLDESRIDLEGNEFTFNENELWDALRKIDTDNKISVIESNFHKSSNPIENETYERNFLKNHCTSEWILSIDADEDLINAKNFFNVYCSIARQYAKKTDFCMNVVMPYKIIDDTVLVIANEDNSMALAVSQSVLTHNNSTFTHGRWTNMGAGGTNVIQSPLFAISWELCNLKNGPLFNTWDQVTLDNYKQLNNFKTPDLPGPQWTKLLAIPKNQVESYYLQQIGNR